MTRPAPNPVVLTCPTCGQSVVVHIPAAATCVPCARTMRPVTKEAHRATA